MRRINIILLILFLTTTSILINGYNFRTSDHSEQLPPILKVKNTELYENDLIFKDGKFNTLPHRLLCHLILYQIYWITNIDVEIIYFAVHIILRLCSVTLIYLIVKIHSKSNLTFVFVTTLLMANRMRLNGSHYWKGELVPYLFVVPFILLCYYLYLKRKYLFSVVIASICTYLHLQLGLITSFLLFISLMQKRKLKKSLILGVIYSIISSYVLLSALITQLPEETKSTAYETIKLRIAHHALPRFFGTDNIIGYLGIIITGIFILCNFKFYKKNDYMHWFKGIIILFTVGTIFTELFPIGLIIKLVLFRAWIHLYIIYSIILCTIIVDLKKSIFAIPFFVNIFVSGIEGINFIFTISVFATIFLYYYFKRKENTNSIYFYFIILIFIIIFILIITRVAIKPRPINIYNAIDTEFEEISIKAKELSKIDALFIIPPTWDGFRLLSERSAVVNFKVAGTYSGDKTMSEWIQRMKDFCQIENWNSFEIMDLCNYNQLNESNLIKFAIKYNATHIVTETQELDLDLIYSTNKYKMYKVS